MAPFFVLDSFINFLHVEKRFSEHTTIAYKKDIEQFFDFSEISKLEDLLDISIPLDDLVDESRAWQDGVDELAAEDEEISEYVTRLESTVDASDLPEASGEAIAREFERYLKRRTRD